MIGWEIPPTLRRDEIETAKRVAVTLFHLQEGGTDTRHYLEGVIDVFDAYLSD